MSMVLIFGWMLIGSAFILLGWGMSFWRHRKPASIWNAAALMAAGMDLHAIGMVMTLYGRLEQILSDGRSFATEDPVYFIGSVLVIAGKSLFVWVAALREGRTYSHTIWWSYVACMALWLLFAGSNYP